MERYHQQSLPREDPDSGRAPLMAYYSPYAEFEFPEPFTPLPGHLGSFAQHPVSVDRIPFRNETSNNLDPTQHTQQLADHFSYNSPYFDLSPDTYPTDFDVNTNGAPYFGFPPTDQPLTSTYRAVPDDWRTPYHTSSNPLPPIVGAETPQVLMRQASANMANTTTNGLQHKATPNNAPMPDDHSDNEEGPSLHSSTVGGQHAAASTNSFPATAASTTTKRVKLGPVSSRAQPSKPSKSGRLNNSRMTGMSSKLSKPTMPAHVVDEDSSEAGEKTEAESEEDPEDDDGEDDEDGENEDDDGFVWIFNSITEAKVKQFDRAPLKRNLAGTDDVHQYVNDNRMQKNLVKNFVAALGGGYLKTPVGGEQFPKGERIAEWKRYQTIHYDVVQAALAKSTGAEQAQKCAWLFVDALLEAHQHGIRKTKNSGTESSLIFSVRANLCIQVLTEIPMLRENCLKGVDIHAIVSSPEGAKKLKIQNLWVNYGKKMGKATGGGKSGGKRSRSKRAKKATGSAEVGGDEEQDGSEEQDGGEQQGKDEGPVEEGNEAGGADGVVGDGSGNDDNGVDDEVGENGQGGVAVQPDKSAITGQKRKRPSR
ncbi:hypothetical protein LTR78_002253 [Recurvomyces mirabilis]|uniref:Uncharacterized protein n=1 Tax=Recurvomyces mirabilis TaxID=574656 RepID=A0AAE0WUN4_9PEZI|nr:hypothetical protein LTR78_002253 [Recurvomyces mirabilis]KAK5160708.1 hypothetical protein LTS14_001721 [Recurvomyces mirabilis]